MKFLIYYILSALVFLGFVIVLISPYQTHKRIEIVFDDYICNIDNLSNGITLHYDFGFFNPSQHELLFENITLVSKKMRATACEIYIVHKNLFSDLVIRFCEMPDMIIGNEYYSFNGIPDQKDSVFIKGYIVFS